METELHTPPSRPISKRRRAMRWANGLWIGLSLICYGSVLVSPAAFSWSGFLALLVPVCIAGNAGFAAFWLRYQPRLALWSILALAPGYPFIRSTLTYPLWQPSETSEPNFSLVSYNVHVFNAYASYQAETDEPQRQFIDWTCRLDADVLCLQEYVNYTGEKDFAFETLPKFEEAGFEYGYFQKESGNAGWDFGLAIFSRFPIVGKGEIVFEQPTGNSAAYADLKMGTDTVRVINAHLQSLHLEEEEVKLENRALAQSAFTKIRLGFAARARQVERINAFIDGSPYPVVVCGDMNDTPYSYTYASFRRRLRSTFEDAGAGFGFTLNHPRLFFLRIDHMFHSERLKAQKYRTLYEADHSDHYPIRAEFRCKPRPEPAG